MAWPAFELTRMRLPCCVCIRVFVQTVIPSDTLSRRRRLRSLFSRRKRTVTAGSSH